MDIINLTCYIVVLHWSDDQYWISINSVQHQLLLVKMIIVECVKTNTTTLKSNNVLLYTMTVEEQWTWKNTFFVPTEAIRDVIIVKWSVWFMTQSWFNCHKIPHNWYDWENSTDHVEEICKNFDFNFQLYKLAFFVMFKMTCTLYRQLFCHMILHICILCNINH